jgi:hypothetical protein
MRATCHGMEVEPVTPDGVPVVSVAGGSALGIPRHGLRPRVSTFLLLNRTQMGRPIQ